MSDDSYETARRYVKEGALGDVVMAQIDYSRNYVGKDFWTNAETRPRCTLPRPVSPCGECAYGCAAMGPGTGAGSGCAGGCAATCLASSDAARASPITSSMEFT